MLETLKIQEGDFVAFSKQANGVLIKPKRVVDPDDTLTREESALIAKARREMKKGKHVTLARNFRDVQSLLLRGVSAERHFEHERLAPQPLSSGPSPESFYRLYIKRRPKGKNSA